MGRVLLSRLDSAELERRLASTGWSSTRRIPCAAWRPAPGTASVRKQGFAVIDQELEPRPALHRRAHPRRPGQGRGSHQHRHPRGPGVDQADDQAVPAAAAGAAEELSWSQGRSAGKGPCLITRPQAVQEACRLPGLNRGYDGAQPTASRNPGGPPCRKSQAGGKPIGNCGRSSGCPRRAGREFQARGDYRQFESGTVDIPVGSSTRSPAVPGGADHPASPGRSPGCTPMPDPGRPGRLGGPAPGTTSTEPRLQFHP